MVKDVVRVAATGDLHFSRASQGGLQQLLTQISEAADVLFSALQANQPLTLTGESSQGLAIEVTGEAVPQAPTPSATPSDESGSDAATATPDPTGTPVVQERVDLPSDIAGQTAAQTTCTKPQE